MRMLKGSIAAASAAVLALGAAACSSDGGGGGSSDETLESMAPITLKLSESQQPTSGPAAATNDLLARITERTNGKVKFETYYASSLLGAGETLQGAGDGIGDVVQVTPHGFPEKLPISNWLLRAGASMSDGWPLAAIQAPLAGADFGLGNEEITQEYADNNVVVLRSGASNFGNAICKKPIETLDDAKGVRIRVTGEPGASEARAIGMEPIVVPSQEMFEGMQRGVFDCLTASDGGPVYTLTGLTELAKYYVPIRFSPTTFIQIVINKDVWDGLPAEVRVIFREEMAQYETERLRATLQTFAEFLDDPSAEGVTFTDPVEINEKLAEYQKGAVQDLLEDAPAGVADPEKLLNEYLDKVKEYEPIAEEILTMDPAAPGKSLEQAYGEGVNGVDYDKLMEAYKKVYSKYVD